MACAERVEAGGDDLVATTIVARELKLIRVLLLALVLDRDAPLRKGRGRRATKSPRSSRMTYWSTGSGRPCAAERLEEKRLHNAVGRHAVRVPALERDARRPHARARPAARAG